MCSHFLLWTCLHGYSTWIRMCMHICTCLGTEILSHIHIKRTYVYTHACVYPCVYLYISICICEDLDMLKHTWMLAQMYMCVRDMCIHKCTCMWRNTALDTHIRAYKWTHAMLMHISTFTYTHVPRCICWHKHNRCVQHMYVYFCPYVHVYVNMHTYRFLFTCMI